MLLNNNVPASPDDAELRGIITQVIYDFAPRGISLGVADEMADSVVFQISTGTLIALTKLSVKNSSQNGMN
jgi:hypothetical protein